MSKKMWLLTFLYICLMFLVGLKPFFGFVFSYTSAAIWFVLITFLAITFLVTENKGSKIRTIVRYVALVLIAGTIFYCIDFEVKHQHIGNKVEAIVENVSEVIEEVVEHVGEEIEHIEESLVELEEERALEEANAESNKVVEEAKVELKN